MVVSPVMLSVNPHVGDIIEDGPSTELIPDVHLLEVMRTPPPWIAGIPLDAEANFGKRYGDCK